MTADTLDAEFVEGYIDGRNPDSLEPSDNRHPAYVHSFRVGRAELAGKPIAAAVSRAAAKAIEARTPPPTGICPQETGQ